MAGQAPNRRQLLQALACASIAGAAPGFCRWAYAFAEPDNAHLTHHPSAGEPAKRATAYKPRFFTPAEYATVIQVAELILPRTSPHAADQHLARVKPPSTRVKPADAGATDAGVAEFIDFMVSHDSTLQPAFRGGLTWLDAAVPSQNFRVLTPTQQTSLLERIAYQKNFRPEEKIPQEFFRTMRRYTVMGFYTSRIGLESLDFPGLQFYGVSPSVPQDGSLERMGVRS